MSLLQTVQQYLGKSEVEQIGNQVGLDPATTESAISAALPMIVGGMAKHASSAEGSDTLQQAMDHHADALDDVPAVVQSPPPESVTGGFLNRIFGSHQEKVQQASGLDFQKVKKLLATLSPLVLSALARHKGGNQPEADSNQVGSLLRREAQKAQEEAPHVGGLLGRLLGA